jgi:putative RecB family exonuclease
LLYLKEPTAIINRPTEQSTRGLERKVLAVWKAIERAHEHDDFRPKPSRLCDWCAFKTYCPAWGGNPDEARELIGDEADGQPAPDTIADAMTEPSPATVATSV